MKTKLLWYLSTAYDNTHANLHVFILTVTKNQGCCNKGILNDRQKKGRDRTHETVFVCFDLLNNMINVSNCYKTWVFIKF